MFADGDSYPAHASAADLDAHSAYFKRMFASRQLQPSLPLPKSFSQAQLHDLIEALYAKQLELNPAAAEPVLRAAYTLGIGCILRAAEQYTAEHFLPESPAEVSSLLSSWS